MNVGTFVGIVALMFVLELPDKTFLATIIMATRARPLMVVVGGASALVIQMGIAVGAGSLLTLFPVHWKDLIVGVLFLGGAAYLLFVSESEEEAKGRREASIEKAATRWKEITTAFVVIFIGEFGDLTQIQAANFEARLHQPLEVFLASSLALVGVTFLGAYSGRALQKRISLKHIRLFGGVVFAGLGLATLIALAVSVG
jgi:putative Ca2+/H+ antiporter (TMEM165/GDT1 family)